MRFLKIDLDRIATAGVALAVMAAALWLSLHFLLPVLLPFLLAWGAALLLRPLNFYLHKKTHLPIRLVSCVTVLLLLFAFLSVVSGILFRLFAEARGILASLLEEPAVLDRLLSRLLELLPGGNTESPALLRFSEYLKSLLVRSAETLAGKLPSVVGSALLTLPEVVLFLLVAVVAAFYFSMDLERVHDTVRSLLPERLSARLSEARRGVFRMGGAYLRAYLTLTGIIFLLMLLGLTLCRVRYPLLLAALLAALDILPVVGVGTVLVPWGIASLLLGEVGRGVGLLVLFGITEIVRQVVEPRLVGHMLGVHPLLSLFSLYLGARFFGILGLLLGPIFAILLKLATRYLLTENKKPVE